MGVQTKVGGAGNKGQDPGHQRNRECMEFLKIDKIWSNIYLILTAYGQILILNHSNFRFTIIGFKARILLCVSVAES